MMNSDYSIPIVQGTAVPSPRSKHDNKASYSSTPEYQEATVVNFNDEENVQPQQPHAQQPNQFRDFAFAVAFVLHLGAMIFVISMNLEAGEDGEGAGDAQGIVNLGILSVFVSIGLTAVSIVFMMRYPTEMVKAGLIFSAILVGAMAVMFFMSGSLFAAVIGLLMFGITIYYVKIVWARIPFAAGKFRVLI